MEIVQSIRTPDRISNIPDNVAEIILMCLPTRDAVRTSILSRKWRHMMARLPQFVLDVYFWKDLAREHSASFTLTEILYPLLINHDGPIKKFTLSNPKLESCPEIDNLIFLLARSHLEDFTLEMWRGHYLLPYPFFSCQKLRHLRLRSCIIRSSPAFNGFSMLITLKLVDVTIDAEMISSLISRSPLLVDLKISNVDLKISKYPGIGIIYIEAPNLRTFSFMGTTKAIMFQRVPVLASVFISLSDGFEWDIGQFFQPLLSLESLVLGYHVFKSIEETLHKRLTTSLIYLKALTLLGISFNDVHQLSFTFCLLRSSPNLKFIQILFHNCSEYNSKLSTTYLEEEDFSDLWLSELKEVHLDFIVGTKPELEITRLLLAKSSSLKKLHIELKKGVDNEIEILKQVTKFPRLSSEAEIIFINR